MKTVLLDSRLYIAGADLSGDGNKIELSDEAEAKTTTNWRSGGAREVLAGISASELNADGYWEAGNQGLPDDMFWTAGREIVPVSVAADGASDLASGTLFYLTKMLTTKRSWLGDVGEVAAYNINAVGSQPLARGIAAHASGVPRTATGTGTAYQLGAVPAGKRLYANLHVLSVAGTATPSITVNVQSDNAIGFPSPVTQGAFAAKTAIGGEAIRIAAPITDDWWRVSWTISGTNPSFLFLATLGIE